MKILIPAEIPSGPFCHYDSSTICSYLNTDNRSDVYCELFHVNIAYARRSSIYRRKAKECIDAMEAFNQLYGEANP